MKLEDQVCSLELAKKLKELGVKQESSYYWVKVHESWFLGRKAEWSREEQEKMFSAFTVAELGEMLPEEIEMPSRGGSAWLYTWKINNKWGVYYQVGCAKPDFLQKDNMEANVRAKMLIYLIENKLIDKEET